MVLHTVFIDLGGVDGLIHITDLSELITRGSCSIGSKIKCCNS